MINTTLHSTLHIVRHSPNNMGSFQNFMRNIKHSDTILLMDDGCYYLTEHSVSSLLNCTEHIAVISEHAKARGVAIPNKVSPINFSMFNKHIFSHKNSVTWS